MAIDIHSPSVFFIVATKEAVDRRHGFLEEEVVGTADTLHDALDLARKGVEDHNVAIGIVGAYRDERNLFFNVGELAPSRPRVTTREEWEQRRKEMVDELVAVYERSKLPGDPPVYSWPTKDVTLPPPPGAGIA